MALGDFPCKTRANTNEFNQGYGRTFSHRGKTYCASCQTSVNEGDKKCWQCKEELTPSKLERLIF